MKRILIAVLIICGTMGLAAALTMPTRTLRHISQEEASLQCESHMASGEATARETYGDHHFYQCYGSDEEIPAYQ